MTAVFALIAVSGSVQALGNDSSVFTGPATPELTTATPPDTLSVSEFGDPPMWARPQAYWLPRPSTTLEGSLHQLREFRRLGLGGITFEPGGVFDGVDLTGPFVPGPGWPFPYLTDQWFSFFDAILAEADRLGMNAYLLDVPFTMSGSAKGQVAEPARGGDPDLGWTTLAEVAPGVSYQQVTRPYWLDPLNPDAVKRSIDLNYALHQKRLGHHFGKALQAMWSDEVSFQPTVSPNTFRLAREIPWSPTFPEYFLSLKGYELTPQRLDFVFHPNPQDPEKRRIAFDYWDAVSARLAHVYYGGIARWTAERGLGFIGQTLGEEKPEQHAVTEGSYFRPAAQPTIISTDLIGEGSVDETGLPFCGDNACYGTTQKLASSAAHLFGRTRVHLEAYDLANDELKHRPQMLRALVDHSVSRGINLFAFHSYDWDGGGYNYTNELYEFQPIWNSYAARLSYLFAPGTTVPEIAVGYPIEAFWIGSTLNDNSFALTSGVLRSAHYEFDYLPIELLSDPETSVEGGQIRYRARSYRGLIVPDWSTVSLEAMHKLSEFVAGGGTLATVGRFPIWEIGGKALSAEDRMTRDAALKVIVSDIFGFDPAAPPTQLTKHAYGQGTAIWMPGNFTAAIQNLTPARVAALYPLVDALRETISPRLCVEDLVPKDAARRCEGGPPLPTGLSAIQTMSYRRAGRDIYFVTNFPQWKNKEPGHFGFSRDFPGQPADIVLDVPASGVPELWDAETGEVSRIWQYEVRGERLRIPLHLPPFASAVIRLAPGDSAGHPHILATNLLEAKITKGGVQGFAPPGMTQPAYAVIGHGKSSRRLAADAPPGKATSIDVIYDVTYSDGATQRRRAGPWTEPQLETGATGRTWFVGFGTYMAKLPLPDPPSPGRLVLDIGRAGDVAEVSVNGVASGTRAWPSYIFDITRAVAPGDDQLAIKVTTSEAASFPDDPLYPAGLLGPVVVRSEPLVTLVEGGSPSRTESKLDGPANGGRGGSEESSTASKLPSLGLALMALLLLAAITVLFARYGPKRLRGGSG